LLNKLWRILSSHTLALWLLISMTLVALAAGSLPQSARLSPEQQTEWETEWEATASWLDTFGLSQIVGSDWFAALTIVLLINMTAGILLSFRRKLAFYRGELKPQYELQRSGPGPEPPPFLGEKPEGVGSQSRVQGIPGLFGLTLFHLGIAVVVLAGFWRGAMDFSDYVELSVGEVFSGQPSKFQLRQEPPEPFDAVLRLDRADIEVRDEKYMGEFRGHFSYQQVGGSTQQASVVSNHPLRLGDFAIYPKQSFGHSAQFERVLQDGSIRHLYIHFEVETNEWGKPWRGKKEQMIRFDNMPLYYSMSLSNAVPPVFDLKVNQGEKVIFEGSLQPGDLADLGAYKLRFRAMVPWMTFNIALDKGVTPIFIGFIITLLGFLLHLLFWPRRVEWTTTDNGWMVQAWVRRGDSAFDEKWNAWCHQQGLEVS